MDLYSFYAEWILKIYKSRQNIPDGINSNVI